MKWLLISLLIIYHSIGAAQDSTYRLSEPLDICIGMSVVMIGGGAHYASTHFRMPPKESVAFLKPMDVIAFDRSAVYNHSALANTLSYVPLYMAVSLPLLHLIPKNSRRDFGKITVMAAEVYALTVATTSLFKNTFPRKRPLMYNPSLTLEQKWKRDNYRSFFSGHTSSTAAMSFFFAQTFSDYHPHSKWRIPVWTFCAALPAATAALRYEAGEHFWTDVITGYAVGALIGTGVPLLHKAIAKHKRKHRP